MGHPRTHGAGPHAHAPKAAPPQSHKQSLSCRHSHAHAATSQAHTARRESTRAQRRTDDPAKSTHSRIASVKRPCSSCGREKKSRQMSSHRLAVSAFERHSAEARAVQRMGSSSLGRTSELDSSSTMTSRKMLPHADQPPARPRRHEARRAAASKLVHRGSVPAHKPLRDAISCTHRRRHERVSSKKRDKAGDGGRKSGGIGSDDLSRMGGSGNVLGEASRSSCVPYQQICRRRARR